MIKISVLTCIYVLSINCKLCLVPSPPQKVLCINYCMIFLLHDLCRGFALEYFLFMTEVYNSFLIVKYCLDLGMCM